MKKTKSRIPLKVFLSYLALASLAIVVGMIVYKEISFFAKAQQDETVQKNKILHIGKLLTLMYESESFARSAIQSNEQEPYLNFLRKNDSISIQIDLLKQFIDEQYQSKLLDSVNHLLTQKVNNITELHNLRTDDIPEKIIETTIRKLINIENKLGRLSLEDFVKNPDSLNPATKKMLVEYVTIHNRYIPRDSTNSTNEKTLDSIVTASREMLQDIKKKSSTQKSSLDIKEKQLLHNDLTTSQQLRQILTAFENDFTNDAHLLDMKQKKLLKRSVRVITIAAIIGVALVIIFSIIILRDSLRSQQHKKQIEDSNEHNKLLLKSREQLISMVSHDLRTPITTILGYTQLLKDAQLNEKEAYYTDRIKNASSYVTQLVDDLLDFTKLEAGKIHLERISFNLNNLIHETAESVQSLYREKNIKLLIDTDQEINKLLLGDPFRIRQILSNLIGNAYKFTPEGSITVKTRLKKSNEKKQLITVSVIDTGIGIKKEKQKIIFEEFTQAESDIETKYGGSGLGLTISKKLANLLNGSLYLESKEGKGSTFSFVFPAEFSHQEVIKKTLPKQKAMPKNKNYTAIVIDDDETLLQLNKEVLEEHHINVYPFNNGKDVLKNIQDIDYDFIITDIQLPSFNGFYFAETLRSDPKYHYQGQPIIAVTGRKDLNKESYIEAGFAEFLFKPYEPQKLIQKINNVLNNIREESVPKNDQKKTTDITSDALYNLDSLQSFLKDKESIVHILNVFKENTKKNIQSLKQAVQHKEYDEVRALGHKMQTMFKQISAYKVIPILDFLEHFQEDEVHQVEKNFKALKKNIKITFEAIDKDLNS